MRKEKGKGGIDRKNDGGKRNWCSRKIENWREWRGREDFWNKGNVEEEEREILKRVEGYLDLSGWGWSGGNWRCRGKREGWVIWRNLRWGDERGRIGGENWRKGWGKDWNKREENDGGWISEGRKDRKWWGERNENKRKYVYIEIKERWKGIYEWRKDENNWRKRIELRKKEDNREDGCKKKWGKKRRIRNLRR